MEEPSQAAARASAAAGTPGPGSRGGSSSGSAPKPVPRPLSVRGKRLGRYVLLEHLASGGMAEIFLARLEGPGGFGKELVLKVLQERYAQNPQVVAMFLEEARLGAQLRHPTIVDVFDVGEDNGLRFIAMEYIEGRTLSELVTRGLEVGRPLPRPYAAHIVAEVAEGLAYLQGGLPGRGRPLAVVHRDISPPNLIVGYSGVTKIIDFGIARRSDTEVDEAGLKPGKVSYMSPEQVRGQHLDGRSDIFSLGTVLYEMTLGRRLFRGPAHTVMRRIVEEEPPPPSYIDRQYPPLLERVVMRALAKRPEDRYSSGAEMVIDLERYLDQTGEPASARHIARYVLELNAPEAVQSARGVEEAREFAEDEESAEGGSREVVLDLDRRPAAAAGAELAHALRDTHPIDLAMGVASAAQQPTSALAPIRVQAGAPARVGATGGATPGAGSAVKSDLTPGVDLVPAAPSRAGFVTVMIVALILGLVAGGLFWMMRGP